MNPMYLVHIILQYSINNQEILFKATVTIVTTLSYIINQGLSTIFENKQIRSVGRQTFYLTQGSPVERYTSHVRVQVHSNNNM